MTFTTPNGIRYPNDPNAYADIIQFFKDMAEDVDTKFVSNKAATAKMEGTLTSKYFIASNGGKTQSSTVLQTSDLAGFTLFDDNKKIDNTNGRRFWIAGAHGTDVAIRTRSDSENLNRISLRAATLDINGAVTINGTLNVNGQGVTRAHWEGDQTLAASRNNWTAVPGAPGFTFVAPPSKVVTIGYGALLPSADKTSQLTYRVREGATLGAGPIVIDVDPGTWDPKVQPPPHSLSTNGTGSAGVEYTSVYCAYVLTGGTNASQILGLKANTTYNVVPYYMNLNAATLKLHRHYIIVTPDL